MPTSSPTAVHGARALPLPPGPKGKPLVGSMLEAWKDPIALMLDGFATYGGVTQFRFAWMRYVTLADSDAAHRVLVENAKNYHKSPNYQGLKLLLGDGLLTSEGDFWRRQRKLAQPAFHRERLAGFVDSMAQCTDDMLARWRTETAKNPAPVDVHREMMRLTFRIVGQTLLSVDLDGESRAVGEALDVALHWANDYVESLVRVPPWVPLKKNRDFLKAKATLDELVLRIVRARRAAMARNEVVPQDLLQMLLEATDTDTNTGMTDEQLKHELLTLVLAGHETTANALTFTLHLLSKNPDARAKVIAEAREALGDRAPAVSDLPKLPYTMQVIEESLRLYPPAWAFERVALEDDIIAGYSIPKGTVIGISPFVMHRNPKYFPDPERFDPARFDRSAPVDRPKHAYVPFGGGPRTCIGNAFALMEMQVILPMILRAFTLDSPSGFKLELEPSVTLRPRFGVPMRRVPTTSA
jgi:cytochrome P450